MVCTGKEILTPIHYLSLGGERFLLAGAISSAHYSLTTVFPFLVNNYCDQPTTEFRGGIYEFKTSLEPGYSDDPGGWL